MSDPLVADAIPTTPGTLAATKLPAWFIADLHLTANRPRSASAFFDFLSGPARRQAKSLFILGDLFESWAGDDDMSSPFNRDVCAALRELSSAGTEIFFMSGNRDLLIGNGFAHATGVRLLADPTTIRSDSRTILLSHGDMLCTDDHDYQAFSRQARDPSWQAGFLAKPLAARREFIDKARAQSETAKQGKRAEIMDVNADAVASLLRAHGYPIFIHGHTHRPGHRTYLLDGHRCERHVLADWHDRALWLAYDGEGFTTHSS